MTCSQWRCCWNSRKSPRSSNSTKEQEKVLSLVVLPSMYQLRDFAEYFGSKRIGLPLTAQPVSRTRTMDAQNSQATVISQGEWFMVWWRVGRCWRGSQFPFHGIDFCL